MDKINTLFLVDDDDIYRFLVKKEIQKADMVNSIQTFSNGLEAINFLREALKSPETLPEIILLDLNMPIMDGWEFLEEYKQLQPQLQKNIAIFIVSSSIAPDDLQKAKSMGLVTDYVVKPITRNKFLDLLTLL